METKRQIPTQWATSYSVPVGWMRQFRYMTHLFNSIRDIRGSVVECGVGEGNTLAMLAYLAGSEGGNRSVWGFDSFQGFPEPSPYDASPRNPQRGEWKVDEALVKRHLEETGIHREYPDLAVQIVPGFLSDTLPTFSDESVAFLHLDVDLYEGYRDGLKYLYSRVPLGGIIAFDEYREFHPNDPAYGDKEKCQVGWCR